MQPELEAQRERLKRLRGRQEQQLQLSFEADQRPQQIKEKRRLAEQKAIDTRFDDHERFVSEVMTIEPSKEAEFLFGHEVLHNVFEHMLVRIGDRDPTLWNIAADYAVNQILKDSNIGEMPKGKKGENKGFQDDKYKDWASERIYDDLYKTAKKNGKKFLEKLGELMDDHQEWGKGEG